MAHFCTDCGAPTDPHDSFCSSCGMPLSGDEASAGQPVMYCSNCGTPLEESWPYCMKCGARCELECAAPETSSSLSAQPLLQPKQAEQSHLPSMPGATAPATETPFMQRTPTSLHNGVQMIPAPPTEARHWGLLLGLLLCCGFGLVISLVLVGLFHGFQPSNRGRVWAWGSNTVGELGNGKTADSRLPVEVLNLRGVVDVAIASDASLALRNDGTLWAWGQNEQGQLGNGNSDNSSIPVRVSGLTDVTAIAGGDTSFYAIKSDGTLWTWGEGPLGNGTKADSDVPVQVPGLTNVKAVSMGWLIGEPWVFVLRKDGTVWAWGSNRHHELGSGPKTGSLVPIQVAGLTEVTTIGGSGGLPIALTKNGTVWTWGPATPSASPIPAPLSGLNNVTSISMQMDSLLGLALKRDGTVWVWGIKGCGGLGSGDNDDATWIPVKVKGLTEVVEIAAGSDFACVLRRDGTVWTWGNNSFGALGIGNRVQYSLLPVQVQDLTRVTKIAAGSFSVCALRDDGTLWSWGADVGSVPIRLPHLENVTSFALDDDHCLAICGR